MTVAVPIDAGDVVVPPERVARMVWWQCWNYGFAHSAAILFLRLDRQATPSQGGGRTWTRGSTRCVRSAMWQCRWHAGPPQADR